MAWNNPNPPNNPWGKRAAGSKLDERLKEWQRRFDSLFRGGGKGGAPSGESGPGGGLLVLIVVLLLLAAWFGSGFFQVRAAERGVIQRFGRYVETRPQGVGWHWPWPIETVTKVNVQNIASTDDKSRVLTADVNLVELCFAVQYRLADPIKVLFRVRDPDETLKEVSESALREIVGRSTLEDVLVGATRPKVTQRSKELIQRTLDFYNTGIVVTSVNLTDVQVPEAVVPSQRDANKALADQERVMKEAQAYANGILPVAQGAAAQVQQQAEAYKAQVVALAQGRAERFTLLADAYAQAPEVTRKRLYMDTLEGIYSRARKIVIDSKNGAGNGNMIYLPLDKLMERNSASSSSDREPEGTVRVSPPDSDADAGTLEPRSRGER